MDKNLQISIIIPVYNEKESLPLLYDKIVGVLKRESKSFEIIFVDDGSVDNSYEIINHLRQKDPRVNVIKFRTNCGKARALNEGFKVAKGSIVFTIDADLQDDPEEIPNFLKKLEEGYDLVSGWKKKRLDPLEKRLPSKLFNKITSLVTGLKLHDFNCGFKAYRREIIEEIKLYGDLHRYIPALAHWKGYHVGEIAVQHHPRKFGESKYGWGRYFRGFFDLFTVVLLTRFIQTPIYLFGLTGLFISLFGLAILTFLFLIQVFHGSILGHKPLSYFGVLSLLFGSQLVATGLIAEMLNNLKARKQRVFSAKKVFSLDRDKKSFDISIIILVQKEGKNLIHLYKELESGLYEVGKICEIIFVDDGINDNSLQILKNLQATNNSTIKIVHLRKTFGKSSALQAGFDLACGNTIVTMDGELQYNINNIILLLNEVDKGADMAIGWRTNAANSRSLRSNVFNRLVSYFTGVEVHDLNCGLKAFRKDVLGSIVLYGGLQSFLPIIIAKKGYRIVEIAINSGDHFCANSKYVPIRILKAFLDLFVVVMITNFKARPLHMFGSVGCTLGMFGLFINLYLSALKFQTGNMGGHYTLLLMGVTLMILGLQWFSTGLLGEIINNIEFKEMNKNKE